MIETQGWLVACCLSGREESVKTWWVERYPDLREDVYYPLARRTVRRGRGKDAKPETVECAAFPGYVFVRESDTADRLTDDLMDTASGVSCFIHFDRWPAIIPDEDIARIKAREASGDFDHGEVVPLEFKVGMMVTVPLGTGVRKGVVTRIKDEDDERRLKLTGGDIKSGSIWVNAREATTASCS